MFENIIRFFKRNGKKEHAEIGSKDTAKERLHLVLMQDRANVSADFLEIMKQEIIEVIKKYIEVDEKDIDVRLTNKTNEDGTTGAPALYANIPIARIKQDINTNKEKFDSKDTIQEDVKGKDFDDRIEEKKVEEKEIEKVEKEIEKVEKEVKEKENENENTEKDDSNKNTETVKEDNKVEIKNTSNLKSLNNKQKVSFKKYNTKAKSVAKKK